MRHAWCFLCLLLSALGARAAADESLHFHRVWRDRVETGRDALPADYLTVVQDPVAWRAFWTYTGRPDPPEVDFGTRDIIVRFYGPGRGLPDLLGPVTRTDRRTVIRLHTQEAAARERTSAVFGGPWYEFVEVDKLWQEWTVERTPAVELAVHATSTAPLAEADLPEAFRGPGVFDPRSLPPAHQPADGPKPGRHLVLVVSERSRFDENAPVLLDVGAERLLVLPPVRARAGADATHEGRFFEVEGERKAVRLLDLGVSHR